MIDRGESIGHWSWKKEGLIDVLRIHMIIYDYLNNSEQIKIWLTVVLY